MFTCKPGETVSNTVALFSSVDLYWFVGKKPFGGVPIYDVLIS